MRKPDKIALLIILMTLCGSAFAQSEAEPWAIVELGAAAARNFRDGSFEFRSCGGN